MKFLKMVVYESVQALGFEKFDDLVISILLAKQTGLAFFFVCISVFSAVYMIVENYIFYPGYTYIIGIGSTVFESVMGTMDSVFNDKEKFNFMKGIRVIPKTLAHGGFLSFSWHMAEAEPIFIFLPTTLFIYLTSINFTKSLWHGSRLGVLPKGVAEVMEKKFEGLKK